MDDAGAKDDLLRYLRQGREALLWKLEGLGEYDVRRPMTRTGTNLLGIVKHLAGVELGYFGWTFDRPMPDEPAWLRDHSDPQGDLWARPEESREDLVALYRRAAAHSDETIAATPLDGTGTVPWWPTATATVPLHRLLVHVATETHRHAGHADILRELVDGAAGHRSDQDNLGLDDDADWAAYVERVEQAARTAAGR